MLAETLYKGILKEKMADCQTYLEIGSYDGDGIVYLAREYPDKQFYSVDPFIEDGHTSAGTHMKKGQELWPLREVFFDNIKTVKNITHFAVTDTDFVRGRLYEMVEPDLFYIDGDHSYEHVSLDLEIAELFALRNPLWVVMDDIVNIKGVKRALQDFKEKHPEVTFNELKEYGGAYFYLR